MALVDGVLDHDKIRRVLDYARALDVEADYLTELVEAASGHMAWVVADMTRKNFDSVISRSSEGLDPVAWITPYAGDNADPALVARYEALGKLPDNSFGKALWQLRQGQRLHLSRRSQGAQRRLRHAARFDARDLGLRHQLSRRDPGLDLHRRHASDQSDGRPHPAGDLQRPSRREVQRRRHAGTGRPRSRTSSGTPGRAAAR